MNMCAALKQILYDVDMKYISIKICLVILALFGVASASDLPDCPTNVWHNCFGSYTWANGDKYIGDWKDNKLNGQGTMAKANGAVEKGIWKDSELLNATSLAYKVGQLARVLVDNMRALSKEVMGSISAFLILSIWFFLFRFRRKKTNAKEGKQLGTGSDETRELGKDADLIYNVEADKKYKGNKMNSEKALLIVGWFFLCVAIIGALMYLSYQFDLDLAKRDSLIFRRGAEGGASNGPVFLGLVAMVGAFLVSKYKKS